MILSKMLLMMILILVMKKVGMVIKTESLLMMVRMVM